MSVVVETSTSTWEAALSTAYKNRIDPERLDDAFSSLSIKEAPPSRLIIQTILDAVPKASYDKDPLIARYLGSLLQQKLIRPGELLLGLLHSSDVLENVTVLSVVTVQTSLPTFEEKVFLMLKKYMDDTYFSGPVTLRDLVLGITKWLHAINDLELRKQLELGPVHSISPSAASMYESLGLLTYTLFSHKAFNDVEKQVWWKQKRRVIAQELDRFDLNVLQVARSQLTGYLHNLTLQRPFLETDAKGRPTFELAQILAAIPVVPTVSTRAGLFVWLCCCLDSRPLTDEATMRNHVLVRYQDNPQNASMSLVLASFDVLNRPKSSLNKQQTQSNIVSFICNKLPLLLTSFATLMSAQTLENCISMALLSMNSGPALVDHDSIQQTKQSFIKACALHDLLTQATVTSLLPDFADAAPKPTKLHRANLVAQCTANPGKLDDLLTELDLLNGNAGAVAGCVVDIVNVLCSSRDVMSLKDVTAKLLRHIGRMDVVLQYAQPVEVIGPVCQLLNDWTLDQDQTEFQPPYEDFAMIYLFTSAVKHRYDLTRTDLGVASDDSFLAKVMASGAASYALHDLADRQKTQLALWIQGLYATDEGGEIVGISDEVYSTCPPQSFYLLVPTIFEQTVLACKAKALSPAIMKAGLEFLLEPFLLPSLISALQWTAKSAWKDVEDTAIRLQILEKLIKSVSSSADVQMMHKAALSIAAVEVERSLQQLLRTTSQKKKEINALIQLLRPICESSTSYDVSLHRLDPSDKTTVANRLSGCIQDLTGWTSTSTSTPPPSFTGRFMAYCTHLLGPTETIDCLVDEIIAHNGDSDGPSVLDICSALVGAPDPHDYSPLAAATMITNTNCTTVLAKSLRTAIADAKTLLLLPLQRGESLVRLQRSVETQWTISPLASQMAMVAMALPGHSGTDPVMQDLSLATAEDSLTTNVVLAEGAGLEHDDTGTQGFDSLLADSNKLLDLGNSEDIFDFKLAPNDGNAQLPPFGTGIDAEASDVAANPDDDIFGDLDMTDLGGVYDFT